MQYIKLIFFCIFFKIPKALDLGTDLHLISTEQKYSNKVTTSQILIHYANKTTVILKYCEISLVLV